MIREGFVHSVTVRYEDHDGGVRVYLFRGTSEDIGQHVARSIKQNLDNDYGSVMTLTPISPSSVVTL